MTRIDPATNRSPGIPPRYFGWLGADLVSKLADSVVIFAVGWLATAYGAGTAAIALSAITLPRTVLTVVGGAVSDRWSPRATMICACAVLIPLYSVTAALTGFGGTPVWFLIALGTVLGSVGAFYLPAADSMPRRLVDPAALPRALAVRQSGSQLIQLVGAPISGALLGWTGMAGTAGLAALAFAVVAVVLLLIDSPAKDVPAPSDSTVLSDVRAGIRLVSRHPVLRPGLIVLGVTAAAALPVPALLVPLLARQAGLAADVTGLLVGCQAVGSILVAVLVARLGTTRLPGLAALIGVAVAGFGVATIAVAPGVVLLAGGAMLAGLGLGLFVSHLAPLLISQSPADHVGRVQAGMLVVQSGSLLLANNVLGLLAAAAGPPVATLTCAALLLATAVIAYRSRSFRYSTVSC